MVGGAGLAPAGPKALVLQTNPLLVTDYPPIYVEEVRFELTGHLAAATRFPSERTRPLCDSSVLAEETGFEPATAFTATVFKTA